MRYLKMTYTIQLTENRVYFSTKHLYSSVPPLRQSDLAVEKEIGNAPQCAIEASINKFNRSLCPGFP